MKIDRKLQLGLGNQFSTMSIICASRPHSFLGVRNRSPPFHDAQKNLIFFSSRKKNKMSASKHKLVQEEQLFSFPSLGSDESGDPTPMCRATGKHVRAASSRIRSVLTPRAIAVPHPIYPALTDYVARNENELSFSKNDVMDVLRVGDVWCRGRKRAGSREEGLFPRDHVFITNRESKKIRTMTPSSPTSPMSPACSPRPTPKTPHDFREKLRMSIRSRDVRAEKREEWSETYRSLRVIKQLVQRARSYDRAGDYEDARTAYGKCEKGLLALLKRLPAESPVAQRCSDLREAFVERSMVLLRAYVNRSTVTMREHYFGMGQQASLRDLFKVAGAKAFFVHYGVRKLRHGRLQTRVLRFDFMTHRMHNLKNGEIVKTFKFSEIKAVSLEEIDLDNGRSVVVVNVSWHTKDRKAYTLLLDNDIDRDSICELFEQIHRSCVTALTLRRRIQRLRLFEGMIHVRPKRDMPIRKTQSALSMFRSMSLNAVKGGDTHVWQRVWAVLYEGSLFCFHDNVRGDSFPILVVPIRKESVRSHVEDDDDDDGTYLPCAFSVGRFYFRAPNEHAARQWMRVVSLSACLSASAVDEMISIRDRGRKSRQTLSENLNAFAASSSVCMRLLRAIGRVCFVEDKEMKAIDKDDVDIVPNTRWRNLGFDSENPRIRLLSVPTSTSRARVQGLLPITERLPLLAIALMKRFGERNEKMMRVIASSVPAPPESTMFNFYELCKELLNHICALLTISPASTSSSQTTRRRTYSDIRKIHLNRPDASGYIASDAFDAILGHHAMRTSASSGIIKSTVEEDTAEVKILLDLCIIALDAILADISIEDILSAATIRLRTTPRDVTIRLFESLLYQPRSVRGVYDAFSNFCETSTAPSARTVSESPRRTSLAM